MKPRVVYLAGAGRSGSTLLAALLGRLPGHVAVGELRYVWQRSFIENQLCGCGTPFRSCPFWTDVVGTAFGGFDAARPDDMVRLMARVDRIRFLPRLTFPGLRPARFGDDLEAVGAVLARLYAAILEVSESSVVVDSSKDPSYAYLLCAQPALDVSVVHLVRDSRAVAYSWTRERVRPEIHWKVEYMRRRPPLLTARRWMQYNALLEALAVRVPRYLRVRYEDLAADPRSTVATIAALVGTGPPPPDEDAPDEGAPVHSVSGNPLRFEAARPVRADLAWQKEMPAGDRRRVTAVTAPLLARYGYLRPARRPRGE